MHAHVAGSTNRILLRINGILQVLWCLFETSTA
jgi:hypothetical protein